VAIALGREPEIRQLEARSEVVHAFSDHSKMARVFAPKEPVPSARASAAWPTGDWVQAKGVSGDRESRPIRAVSGLRGLGVLPDQKVASSSRKTTAASSLRSETIQGTLRIGYPRGNPKDTTPSFSQRQGCHFFHNDSPHHDPASCLRPPPRVTGLPDHACVAGTVYAGSK
jgi:hypothetical protein